MDHMSESSHPGSTTMMHVFLLIMLLVFAGFVFDMSQRSRPGVLILILLSSSSCHNLGFCSLLEAASPGTAVRIIKVREGHMLEPSGLSNLLPAVLLSVAAQLDLDLLPIPGNHGDLLGLLGLGGSHGLHLSLPLFAQCLSDLFLSFSL